MLDISFSPDRASGMPLYLQLVEYLKQLVECGRVTAGEKLPATRELAAALAIGRRTAGRAYGILVDEGVLVSHVGQGTFVSAPAEAHASQGELRELHRPFAWEALFSRAGRTSLPEAVRPRPAGEIRFDFRGGRVDTASLPFTALRRAYARALREGLTAAANPLDPLGHAPLRDQIARILRGRGIRCAADDILVTCGAQQALSLVAEVLIEPGDAVAIEQPGYFGAAMTFEAAGARLVGIDVDSEGLRTDALARALRARRLKLVYTTPAAQLPTGAVLSAARRRALLELADSTQTPVLEDDYDSEFRFGDPPPAALKTRDSAGQVIYVGTFSKALFPGMRLGYLVAARPLLARLAMARFRACLTPDALSQVALCDLLTSGAFERHVRRVRKLYSGRRSALLEALEGCMPAGTTWNRPSGGLMVWVTLPREVDIDAFHRAAHARGLALHSGTGCYCDGRGTEQIALSFASQTSEAIRNGIALLGECVARHGTLRRSA